MQNSPWNLADFVVHVDRNRHSCYLRAVGRYRRSVGYYRANDYNINKSKKHVFRKQETTPHHLGVSGTFLEQI